MKAKLIDLQTNKEIEGGISLSKLFDVKEIRFDLIKKVITWQLNKARAGTHKVKTISEIRGTTAKPFKQKGTGNARQGSKRATQFRGGATVFGPVVRDHSTKLPKKVRKLGFLNSVAHHIKNENIIVVKESKLKDSSTKTFQSTFNSDEKSLVIYSSETDVNILQSIRNLKNVNILNSNGANVYDIMNNNKIFIMESALELIENRVAK